MQTAAFPRDSAESRHHHLLNMGIGAWYASSPITFTPALEVDTVVTPVL